MCFDDQAAPMPLILARHTWHNHVILSLVTRLQNHESSVDTCSIAFVTSFCPMKPNYAAFEWLGTWRHSLQMVRNSVPRSSWLDAHLQLGKGRYPQTTPLVDSCRLLSNCLAGLSSAKRAVPQSWQRNVGSTKDQYTSNQWTWGLYTLSKR